MTMITLRRYIFFSVYIFFLSGCTERTTLHDVKQKEITDPYTESFFGRDIQYMLKENPFDKYDTITFDSLGNMIKMESIDRTIRMEFDKDHYLIRHLIEGHSPEHNLITYDTSENILIQKWVRIMTFKWDYTPEDINQLKTFYSVFTFNEKNQLLKEINLKDNFIINHLYEGNHLVRRDRYDLIIKTLSGTWKYFYDGEEIKRIEEYYYGDHENIPDVIHYFNDGRLDSTQRLSPQGKISHTGKYRYIYFK